MNFELTDEQKMIQEMARKFAEREIKPVAAELDRTHSHPAEICAKMGELGLMGVTVPGRVWRGRNGLCQLCSGDDRNIESMRFMWSHHERM